MESSCPKLALLPQNLMIRDKGVKKRKVHISQSLPAARSYIRFEDTLQPRFNDYGSLVQASKMPRFRKGVGLSMRNQRLQHTAEVACIRALGPRINVWRLYLKRGVSLCDSLCPSAVDQGGLADSLSELLLKKQFFHLERGRLISVSACRAINIDASDIVLYN